MAVNPMEFLKMKQRLDTFNQEHPRVAPFLEATRGMIREGSVIELSITTPEGEQKVMNIKVKPSDIETLQMFAELSPKS
ncbi:MAG: hypothetical protein U0L49_04620 [Eubacterium sp.]|nr:hypothetical protein [Eubacterium sp.]